MIFYINSNSCVRWHVTDGCCTVVLKWVDGANKQWKFHNPERAKAVKVLIRAKIKMTCEIFLWNVITFNQIWSGFIFLYGILLVSETGVSEIDLFHVLWLSSFRSNLWSGGLQRVNLAQFGWLHLVIKWAAQMFLSFYIFGSVMTFHFTIVLSASDRTSKMKWML